MPLHVVIRQAGLEGRIRPQCLKAGLELAIGTMEVRAITAIHMSRQTTSAHKPTEGCQESSGGIVFYDF